MKNTLIASLGVIILSGFLGFGAYADHVWGYHWARQANPFTLKLGDNLTGAWDPYLAVTASDWSLSSVLDANVVFSGKNPKTCKPTVGRGEICNAKYGFNGWLGVAQVWALGEHITQGTVKMNDSYFNQTKYNTSAWKNLVMCQEVGHLFGLDHQDENTANGNLGTCMDYTADPSTNQHPNAHDYEALESIYAHLDSNTSVAQSTASLPAVAIADEERDWGREVSRSRDGRHSAYERRVDGSVVLTHVFWTDEAAKERGRDR